MSIPVEFVSHVTDAYAHLYDLVYLRTHPLVDLIVADPALRGQDKAWQLHHILMAVIDELDPGPRAPVSSHEWRRHRLMVLRYVEALDAQSVARQLSISRRQYYREHKLAMEAAATVLRARHMQRSPAEAAPRGQTAFLSRIELLRLEAARNAQAGRHASLHDVLSGVLSVWECRLAERNLTVVQELPQPPVHVSMSPSLLRQLLLGILGHLIERSREGSIRLAAELRDGVVCLTMSVDPPSALQPPSEAQASDVLAGFRELALLGNAELTSQEGVRPGAGILLRLPLSRQRSVLVVDDNEDVLELFRRYLMLHHYDVVVARTAQEALDLARRLQPQAISLDLMMPEQDGWDLLRDLLGSPATRDIPVIVCSVLPQREAALSLGATAFLPKPVGEQDLVALLDALIDTD